MARNCEDCSHLKATILVHHNIRNLLKGADPIFEDDAMRDIHCAKGVFPQKLYGLWGLHRSGLATTAVTCPFYDPDVFGEEVELAVEPAAAA